jgi:hypothetical protein
MTMARLGGSSEAVYGPQPDVTFHPGEGDSVQVCGWQAGTMHGRLTAEMHALTGWRITQWNEEVGMSGSGSTFVPVATYPDEAAAREDHHVVKDAHAAGPAGSCDAAAVTKDATLRPGLRPEGVAPPGQSG